MKSKKYQGFSRLALVFSLLPLATFIPVLLKLTLPAGVSTVWAGVNVVCIILGLSASVICVKNSESRSIVNIASTVISCLWLFVMAGIVALALFINFM